MSINLIKERLDRGLSRREAAVKIGVSRGVLEGAEAGRGVHPQHGKKIADFYGYRVTEIWPVEERAA